MGASTSLQKSSLYWRDNSGGYRKYIETDAAPETICSRLGQRAQRPRDHQHPSWHSRKVRSSSWSADPRWCPHRSCNIGESLSHCSTTSGSAIDLVDEACARCVFFPDLLAFDASSKPHTFSVRVTRETAPETIELQRRKLELEVEIHALECEKDQAAKDRLQVARKAIAQVGDSTNSPPSLLRMRTRSLAAAKLIYSARKSMN